ncbi:MAG: DMT family transporter [Anaerolineales bacterium]|nr:MAG: DMT family transporter [Anaerolineales bacterium]
MQKRTLAILAGLLAVTFWGASFIAIKIALKQAQPITLIVIRLGIGLCVLYPIAWIRGELGGLSFRDHVLMILLGVIGVTGHQWLQAEGMLSAGATTASWLAALAPAFMVILAGFFLQERIAPGQVAGLVLALFGALLVAVRNEGLEIGRGDWVGPALLLGSALAWAAFSIAGKAIAERCSPLQVAVYTMTWGWLSSFCLSLINGDWTEVLLFQPGVWWALIFLGVASTGFAYALYFFALSGSQTTTIAALQYLEPLITLIIAVVLLGEIVTTISLLGGGLILFGVAWVERSGSA